VPIKKLIEFKFKDLFEIEESPASIGARLY